MAREPRTMVDLLRARAEEGSEAGYVLTDGVAELERVSYPEMDARARRIASALSERVAPGSRALLLFPQGLDFLAAFYGCLYAGVLAVPAYPPDPARLSRTLPRLEAILRDARAELVLTTGWIADLFASLDPAGAALARVPRLATDDLSRDAAAPAREPARARPEDVAFVQYTSGSVGTPKGVLVRHGNIVDNLSVMRDTCLETGRAPDVVGWVPLFHDMGLVLDSLLPVMLGTRAILMSPADFLRDPMRWLATVHRYRAGLSGGPNFAYELCVRKTSEDERAGLDLSSWDIAANSAEPVRAETLARFVRAFEPHGFAPTAFLPCYGLAEATLVVTLPRAHSSDLVRRFSRDALAAGRAEPADDEDGVELVGVGSARRGNEVAIVDPETMRRVLPGEIGEIWVRGPSVGGGYFGDAAGSAAVFGARIGGEGPDAYLRTGDLGFVHEAASGPCLFVTGRRKDVIIVRGRNYYPQDLEQAADRAHPLVRPGCAIAFATERDGTEEVTMVVEAQPAAREALVEAARAIATSVAFEHDLFVHRIEVIAPRALPKTSSGKLQRGACRAELASGRLEVLASVGQDELLEAYLRARLAVASGVHPREIDLDGSIDALGVDSLGRLELLDGLSRASGSALSADDLSEVRSARELLGRAGRRSPRSQAPPAEASGVASVQEAMLRDEALLPGSHTIAIGLNVRGPIDAGALIRRARELVRAHPILRLAIERTDASHRIVEGDCAVHVLDAPGTSEAEVRDWVAERALSPLVRGDGPVRLVVAQRSERDFDVVFVLHHLGYDAWTLAQLVREYVRRAAGLPVGEPASGYGRFVAYDRAARDDAALIERAAAWDREHIAGRLFAWSSRDLEAPVHRAAVGLDATVVRARARAAGVTPFAWIAAACGAALAGAKARDEVVLGTTVSLRGEAGLAGIWGPVFNYAPLRIARRDPVASARASLEAAQAFRAVPFLERLRLLGVEEGPSLGLAANVSLYDLDRLGGSLLARLRGERLAMSGLSFGEVPLADLPVIRPYALSLSVVKSNGALSVGLRSRASFLDATELRELAGALARQAHGP